MATLRSEVVDAVLLALVQVLMLAQVAVGYARLWCRSRFGREKRWDLSGDRGLGAAPVLSVVIPAYKEVATIERTLRRVLAAAADPRRVEVVVVDAGGGDGAADVARRVAAEMAPQLRVRCDVASTGGRGPAVAAGAAAAKGDAVLFLHSDTLLPRGFDADVLSALADPRTLATCFRFGVDREVLDARLPPRGSWRRWLAEFPFFFMEATVARRSSLLQLPFGDQALALRRATFVALGGLKDIAEAPILEDFLLVHRLRVCGARGLGNIANLGTVARCDPRRWLARPVWRVNLDNQRVMVAFTYLDYTLDQIFELYYGTRAPAGSNSK